MMFYSKLEYLLLERISYKLLMHLLIILLSMNGSSILLIYFLYA